MFVQVSRRSVLAAAGAAVIVPTAAGCLPARWGSREDEGYTGPVAAALGAEGHTVVVGNPGAPVTVRVYEDPSCPGCAEFQTEGSGPRLRRMAADGDVQVHYVLGSFLGNGSKRAVNALRASLDKGKFAELHEVLHRGQATAKKRGGFTGDRLLSLASSVDGLRDAGFDEAVRTGKHREFVEAADRAVSSSWIKATPALEVDGRPVGKGDQDVLDDPDALARYLRRARQRSARG
ncbi:hypothetical protein GCM10010286_03290 [Streptomyces toxytricini]|nr:hypothetical protein GCM10010286_03290 [Streptomyces toxytricini]